MYFSKAIIASALVGFGFATAQAGESVPASEASAAPAAATGAAVPAGMVATHVIQVGGPNGSLTFSPENIKAAVGDLVQFQFYPKVCSS